MDFGIGHRGGGAYGPIWFDSTQKSKPSKSKSSADTLKRLAHQAWYYGKAFDEVSLVADSKHLPLAEDILPSWWGLWEVSASKPVRLRIRRVASQNPWQDGLCLASLLNRSELTQILCDVDSDLVLQETAQQELWSLASQHFSIADLRLGVLDMLASRFDVAGQLSP